MPTELDIVIPVYNEGANIIGVLDSLRRHVKTPFRILICYDHDHDDTLVALRDYSADGTELLFVKNRGRGALGAVLTGFEVSTAPAVLVLPADDDYNAPQLDQMVEQFRSGADIVIACRFMPGGAMVGCPWVKAVLVRATGFLLYRLARLPARDPTNGFRLFSRRVIDRIPVTSKVGFAYSLELLVKAHRLGWNVAEVPVHWFERKAGQSRFKVFKWAPQYLVWVCYAIETSVFRRGPDTVVLRPYPRPAASFAPTESSPVISHG
jgi:glycosyltransferase involved in cell wall biosynthesis